MQLVGKFNQEDLRMTLWGFSRRESLTDAWSLFAHAQPHGHSLSPPCFEVMLMECGQRGLLEHEIALLKGLERTGGAHGGEAEFGATVKHVGAMRLAKTKELKSLLLSGRLVFFVRLASATSLEHSLRGLTSGLAWSLTERRVC